MARVCSSKDEIRLLQKDGWIEVGQRGSHVQFRHPLKTGRVTVPHPRKEIRTGTLHSIWHQAGWSWPPE